LVQLFYVRKGNQAWSAEKHLRAVEQLPAPERSVNNQAVKMMSQVVKLTFVVFILNLLVSVFSENYHISDVCYNYKWSGRNFLKSVVHQSTCEPYNATDLKDKLSLIYFEV